jgi:peroxiredoxin
LLEKQQKSLPEAIKSLAEWRDRLGETKPVAEAGEPAAASIRRQIVRPPVTDPDLIGKPAPDFTLKDVDGRELALKDLRGKTVLLNFWATWCAPCREEMPQLKALYDEFKDKGLEVIAIDYSESAEIARKYFDEHKYTFRSLLDPGRAADNKYGAGGIPKVVLIDKDGIVRYFQRGFNSRMDFRAEVTKLGL